VLHVCRSVHSLFPGSWAWSPGFKDELDDLASRADSDATQAWVMDDTVKHDFNLGRCVRLEERSDVAGNSATTNDHDLMMTMTETP
jgi:hypothetical protein